jgi:imidazolonepropionase-like amidohydrolase
MPHPTRFAHALCAAAALGALACAPETAPAPKAAPPGAAPPASPKAVEARVERRSVVVLSRRAGTSVATYRPDGTMEFAYEHLDNGRGPKFEARGRLAADGTLASFEAKGKHTMGNPIDERFSVEGQTARWKSPEEHGQRALLSPAFYVPIAPLPDATGLLFAALSRAGGRLALLPGGEARLERAGAATVRAGGREKRLVAWAIVGLDLTPTRLWAEEDGAYFGVTEDWYSCVPEGWEDAIAPLLEEQKGHAAKHDRDLVDQLARRPPAEGLAVVHARVLDVERKRWLDDHTVVAVGGKIVAVGPSKATKVPKGAETVDAAGKALLPGLWDMHAHVSQADGVLDVASGVTTARDLGNDPDRLDDYKKRFDEGSAVGPRLLRSGFIEGRGEKAAGSKVTATTEDEAKAAVEFYAARGYEGIKIYNSMKPELVPTLARLAHEKKMRVSGHVPAFTRAEDMVRAGYDEIQHVNMLFLNFFVDKDTDTRSPLRFSLVADRAPGLDLASKPVQAFLKLLVDKHTVVDPTLAAFEDLFTARPGKPAPGVEALVERLPALTQRAFLTGGLAVPEGKDEHYRRAFEKTLEMVKKLYDSKIPLVAGTDMLAGLFLHHELELYARAGIPAGDVLQIATLGSARIMKRDKTTGSIAAGKDADFFLVDGDPLARVADLRKVTTSVRGGTVYDSAALYAAVGVKP